jgi:hypothetical protein
LPWASTSPDLLPGIQRQLREILKRLPCLPPYTEVVSQACPEQEGGKYAVLTTRQYFLRLWPLELLCAECGGMHEDKLQWVRLLTRACGMLSGQDFRNLARHPLEYSPRHVCPNHGCNNASHYHNESRTIGRSRRECLIALADFDSESDPSPNDPSAHTDLDASSALNGTRRCSQHSSSNSKSMHRPCMRMLRPRVRTKTVMTSMRPTR